MLEPDAEREVARLYIDDWMKTKPGLDRKGLAKLMNTAPSNVTKKLQKPDAIDIDWLTRFANALGCAVEDLFRAPDDAYETDPHKATTESEIKALLRRIDRLPPNKINMIFLLIEGMRQPSDDKQK